MFTYWGTPVTIIISFIFGITGWILISMSTIVTPIQGTIVSFSINRYARDNPYIPNKAVYVVNEQSYECTNDWRFNAAFDRNPVNQTIDLFYNKNNPLESSFHKDRNWDPGWSFIYVFFTLLPLSCCLEYCCRPSIVAAIPIEVVHVQNITDIKEEKEWHEPGSIG